jgi:hypothetical protein
MILSCFSDRYFFLLFTSRFILVKKPRLASGKSLFCRKRNKVTLTYASSAFQKSPDRVGSCLLFMAEKASRATTATRAAAAAAEEWPDRQLEEQLEVHIGSHCRVRRISGGKCIYCIVFLYLSQLLHNLQCTGSRSSFKPYLIRSNPNPYPEQA